jgi:hypothetical protein
MLEITIHCERTGRAVATAELANRRANRRRGLLGRDRLAPGSGILLQPCSSVHSFFMRFAIDVVFLDRDGRIQKIVERLPAGRLAWGGWRAWQTLELAAGASAAAELCRGDRLIW